MIAEEEMLANVDPRHVAFDASLPWRNRADATCDRLAVRRARGQYRASMTFEAFRIVQGAVWRSRRVGVVARDTTEGPPTLLVAFRLHEPDRLEPSQNVDYRA